MTRQTSSLWVTIRWRLLKPRGSKLAIGFIDELWMKPATRPSSGWASFMVVSVLRLVPAI